MLTGLLTSLIDPSAGGDVALQRAVESARIGQTARLDLSASNSARAFVMAALASPTPLGAQRTVLAVTATGREAEDLVAALRALLPDDDVAEFPAWETLPHERLSPRSDTVGRRLAVLRRLVHPTPGATRPKIVVAPVRSVLQPQVTGLADLVPVRLTVGQDIPLGDVIASLAGAAYARVDLVEKRGEFAVRGGLIDVFPPTAEHPLRVEFWGDTVEEIRQFAVADQRSIPEGSQNQLWAPPCRELLLSDEVRARAAALALQYPVLNDMLDKIANGIAVEGMESLTPVLASGLELFVDVLPAGSMVVVCDPERVRRRAHDLVATSQEFLEASWASAAGGGTAPIDLGAAAYRSFADVRAHAMGLGLPWWGTSPFSVDDDLTDPLDSAVTSALDLRDVPSYRGDTDRALSDIRGWIAQQWRVVVLAEGHGTAARAVEVLRDASIPVRLVEDVLTDPEPGVVHVSTGTFAHGFVAASAQLAVVTVEDITGRRGTGARDQPRLPSRRKQQIDPLQLAPGDFVVHEQHGVGKYVEMTQRQIQGAQREYLVIEYAASKRGQPGDRLYVPTDQLELVTRYVGGDHPSLDRIGGADWTKRKGRARKAVKQIAAELVKLYAARTSAPGFAFSPDTPWQRELEDAFPYVETPDQVEVINEVKRDMERAIPMDRVVCGDVGYGKTEVAVRAAFKAVQDGKQVAVLVPTTLLVSQHSDTFSDRYGQFPVVVRALSRFQSDKEAKEVLQGLVDGAVDVVIGTHRLLGPDIRFKNLGLVIVDEEQRFGVEHKEQLKRLRTHVDVLTMSATPIPRTLEMSITGIRDMSTITTPPEERHPVLTYVGVQDDRQIAAAIRRELLREGQVFYVHNRVDSIERSAARLRDLVPEARIVTAHGQMGEHALEQVIADFWERRADVLVCTTIVETGLDISNANTLVVERSDLLGLSQLHQLRGRVGRGRERAYAYFLYPRDKPLTETAHDRLVTIAQNSDLGAGMAVAMKDLEIRGSGNLLGGEQSGHIADVGFDLYVRLVGEAVAEYRGDATSEVGEDLRIDLPVDAHLPHDYVPSERLRLEVYKRLSSAHDEAALANIEAELADRYGPAPEEVTNLLAVAGFRVFAKNAGLHEISAAGPMVRFGPVELKAWQQARLARLYPQGSLKAATSTMVIPRPKTGVGGVGPLGGEPIRDLALLGWARRVIHDILLDDPAAAGQVRS